MAGRLPPGVGHVLLGLAIQGVSAAVLAGLYSWLPPVAAALAGGGWCAIVFYASRERRQAEEAARSNAIAPWRWLPRSLRDIGWPALAVAIVTGLGAWLAG